MRRVDSSALEGCDFKETKSATSSSRDDGQSSSDDEEISTDKASCGAKKKPPRCAELVLAPHYTILVRVEVALTNAQDFANPWQ